MFGDIFNPDVRKLKRLIRDIEEVRVFANQAQKFTKDLT